MGGKRGVTAKSSPPAGAEAAPHKPRACLHRQLQKTRMCVYYMRGTCQYGTNCSFAHAQQELSTTPDLQRTRLCTSFAKGQCDNPNCSFAHGEAELRSTDMFFKKAMCIWHDTGRCRNGEFCRFAHGSTELRASAGSSPGVVPQGANGRSEMPCDDPAMQAVVAQAQVLAAAFVAGQVSAQKAAVEPPVLAQHRPVQQPRQHMSGLEQQHLAQQQMMRAREMHAHAQLQARQAPFIPGAHFIPGEPMKVTSGNAMQLLQAQRTEPPPSAAQFGNVPKELAALGQLAIQLHQAGMPVPPPPALPHPDTNSPASSGPAVAAGALAALAALKDANLARHFANAHQGSQDANLQAELANLCESISTLSVQCNRLQQQVQSQLTDNPGSTGSATTTAESQGSQASQASLPGWGGFSEMGSHESFSPQISQEYNSPAMLLGKWDTGGLEAQDTTQCTAQWAAALRLVSGLQQL